MFGKKFYLFLCYMCVCFWKGTAKEVILGWITVEKWNWKGKKDLFIVKKKKKDLFFN